MVSMKEMVKEAEDEAFEEDMKACKEGLKVLTKRKRTADKELEKYKDRIQNDLSGAADMFRGDNLGRSLR